MEQKVTTPVVKGLIITLILAVLDLVGGFAHLKLETWFKWIPTLVLCAAIIWACISYGSQLNGNTTFGNAFAHGFKTSAVVACILILYTLLSIYIIFPETKDLAIEEARKQMEAKGNIPDATIDQALEMTRKFFLPFAIGGALIGTLIVGAIASLIGAAVTKKNPNAELENQFK
jgi:NADH:ubiquinone oxidoreductase subunit 6 (subunit J)